MIHSTEYNYSVSNANNNSLLQGTVDLPLELSDQLQRLIRQGNFFKVVGIDFQLSPFAGSTGSVTGYLRYFAPTRGRCAAYRQAFKAMADLMKTQGISMRDNANSEVIVGIITHRNSSGWSYDQEQCNLGWNQWTCIGSRHSGSKCFWCLQ